MRLLLVEDDPYLQENLVRSLSRRGLQVTSAATAAQAVSLWQSLRPDVVLLDLTLPDGDGLNVVSQVRQLGFTTPVLVLTARTTVGDRVLGLNSGADDYMAKPFDLDELEARLNALYRRTKTAQQVSSSQVDSGQARNALQTLQLGAVSLDTLNGVAYLHQQAMELTPREVAMLQALMAHAGQAVSKERLFSAVFPDELDVQFEAIEVVAYRLRKN
jgi:two-component system response regulator TctD